MTLESKRLGARVHELFNGGKYNEALTVAEQQRKLLRDAYGEVPFLSPHSSHMSHPILPIKHLKI